MMLLEEKVILWDKGVEMYVCVHVIGVLADFTTLMKRCHFSTLLQEV